jgi:S1-C subfamily serine protease
MRQTIRALLLGLAVIVLAACGKSGSSNTSTTTNPSGGAAQPTSTTASKPASVPNTADNTNNTGNATPIERVVQQLQPSVVRVSVSAPSSSSGPFGRAGAGLGGIFGGAGQSQAQQQGVGTGMVLDSQGHILTNNHVVTLGNATSTTSVNVDLPDGKTVSANVVGTDPQTDLAVIQVGSADRGGIEPIQWADPNSIVVGEQVVGIGYALDLGGAPTVTMGIVSAINRSIPEQDATISGAIQTDAAINEGNSGGPLLDLSGKVLGVNTAGLVGTPTQPAQGLNFAISVQTARPVVQSLISQGHVTRGYMGVAVTDVTPDMAQANDLGVKSGAGVGQVTSGSPADQAGLKPGDIIIKVGDVSITNTGDLTSALSKYGPGQKVPVTYYRNKNQQTSTMTLGQRPAGGG